MKDTTISNTNIETSFFYMCTSWWSSYLDKLACVVPLEQTWEWGRRMPVAELLQRRRHPGYWCNFAEQRSLAQEPPGQHWRYTPGLPQMWSRLGQKSSPSLFGMLELSPQSGAVPGRQIWGGHSRKHQSPDHNTTRHNTVDGCPAPVWWGKSLVYFVIPVVVTSKFSNSVWTFVNHAWFVLLQI